MRCLHRCIALVVTAWAWPLALGAQTARALRPFANTGAPAAQAAFVEGLTALHNFQYREAALAFQSAQRSDPRFALAYWGEAMTHAHLLWNEYDVPAARAALAKLAPSAESRRARAGGAVEQDLLAAADALFEHDSVRSGLPAYASRLETIHKSRPDDSDVAALYALAVIAQAPLGPAGMRLRAPAIDVLERAFARTPRHAGVVHYLIHAYDDVDHAALGLRAAEVYAALAPASSHAQHMPSHIFLQLGRWAESTRSNQAAYDASVKVQEERGWLAERRDWHALLWLSYSLAQQGRYERLDEVVAHFRRMAAETNHASAVANAAAAHAIRTLESGEWATAPTLAQARAGGPLNEASVLVATAFGAVHRRDSVASDSIRARLAELVRSYERAGTSVPGMLQVISGIIDVLWYATRDQRDSVIATVTRVAALERRQPLTSGIPLPLKPASEMYGEVLLAFDRPREAREQFSAVLQRIPKRPTSLWGLARAHAALGDTAAALSTLDDLQGVWAEADTGSQRMRRLRDLKVGLSRRVAPALDRDTRTQAPGESRGLAITTAFGVYARVTSKPITHRIGLEPDGVVISP